MHTPPMTKQQIDRLTPFLDIFSRPGYRPFLTEDQLTMESPNPPEVEAFCEAYTAVCAGVAPSASLPEDPAGLDPTELYTYFSKPDVIATASANQIRRYLLVTSRGDYLGFLATANRIADGVIPAALRRLRALRDAAPDA